MSIRPITASSYTPISKKRSPPSEEFSPYKKYQMAIPQLIPSKPLSALSQRSWTLEDIRDIEGRGIRLGPHEKRMLQVTIKAAKDHQLDPNALPIEDIQRTTKPLQLKYAAIFEYRKAIYQRR